MQFLFVLRSQNIQLLHNNYPVLQSDAIPEILKNMLLVMETTQVFHTADGFTRLWTITWDRIDAFLPDFRHHIFRSHPPCMCIWNQC